MQRIYVKLCYVHNLDPDFLGLGYLTVVVVQTIAIELNILFIGGEDATLQNLVDRGASQIARGLGIWQRVESLKILIFGLLMLWFWLMLYVVVLAVHCERFRQDAVQV